MTKENVQEFAVALTASPSEGTEAKRNKKTQLLSALLSASALGVFLEGCGAGGGDTSGGVTPDPDPTPTPTPTPTPDPDPDPVSSVTGDGSEENPFLATSVADSFTGSTGYDWVSYAGSNAGVTIDLGADTASGGWAAGDTLTDINNLIGSNRGDQLYGNSGDNTLRGGAGVDFLYGGTGNDILDGGGGVDSVIYGSSATRIDLSRAGSQVDFDGSHGFTANQGGDAVGDTLIDIENVAASNQDDWLTGDGNDNFLNGKGGDDRLEGGAGDDTLLGGGDNDYLEGGAGLDTYLFRVSAGIDSVVDDGGKIVFDGGSYGNYTGAIYTFTRVDASSEAVTLTVSKDGNTLNVIEFASDPSSDFTFSTRYRGTDTEIDASLLVVPPRVVGDGSESNPFEATADADPFTGSSGADWVSYAGSNAGVTIDLSSTTATVSGGWAARDTLTNIDNLIGSRFVDTLTGDSGVNSFEGGRGDDVLAGGTGIDTYVFNKGDGTDTITDSGGSIVFEQGTDNDYAGAIYTFTRPDATSEAVTLTVSKDGNTLNVIEFASDPSSDFTFSTRYRGTDTEIDASLLVVPPRVVSDGSESNPFLATDTAEIIMGSLGADWVSYAGSTERRRHHRP